jgi:NCAIR mutase (PurE)-related protein
MARKEVQFDFDRQGRIGLSEAVLCEGKSVAQVEHIVSLFSERSEPLLLTRLAAELFGSLGTGCRGQLDYDPVSRTAIVGECPVATGPARVAVVAAGTSDASVCREASRTLAFHAEASDEFIDIGVAGLWRVLDQREWLNTYATVIVVAGMDGALFSVVGGLVGSPVIAVPTATGYGASHGGMTALNAALASCAPGIVVVNIGNGYGGACAALRVLRGGRGAAVSGRG